jgi:hypothetical protein
MFCIDWVFSVKVSRGITQCPPTGLEPLPTTSVALTAQYLNVLQHKLGTVIIQTIQSGHRLTVQRKFLHGQLNLISINLAR